jgi:hypothetical protein
LDVSVRFGATDQEQLATVGGRHDDVEHLHGSEFLEDGARHETAGQTPELLAQRVSSGAQIPET